MLRAYDARSKSFIPLHPERRTAWVHAADPSLPEIRALEDELEVPAVLLRHALDVDEIARVAKENGAFLVVIRLPVPAPTKKVPVRVVSLGIAASADQIVTVSRVDSKAIDELLDRVVLDPQAPMRGILKLLLEVAEEFMASVRDIEERVDRLEDKLAYSQKNEEVFRLLRLQKALINIETALGSNSLMLERLQKEPQLDLSDEEKELLEDVLVEQRQALSMTKVLAGELASTVDAFASIISNNLNVAMKVLTSLTIIVTLPAIVAGLWGMNVALPLEKSPAAFWILLGGALALSCGVALLFRMRRWL